ELAEGWATSDDLPGVRIAGAPFMGVMGVAPSADLLRTATAREAEVAARGGVALPPDPAGAVPADPALAAEGLRTIPPREHGGNIDIKQVTAGTRLLLPVWVDGARFSAGDAHFAQGDGESCGTAIEMAATLRVRLDLRPAQAAEREIRTPCYERDTSDPAASVPPGPSPQSADPGREIRQAALVWTQRRRARRLEANYGSMPQSEWARMTSP